MTVNSLSMGLLSAGGRFDPSGVLVLFGGLALIIVFYVVQRNRRYQAALTEYNESLKKYEAQLAEYNEAVARLAQGQPAAAGVDGATVAAITAAVSAATAASGATAVSGGEVTLTGVDEKTAAMLLAIVCDTIGGDPAQLRFAAVRAL